MGSRSTLVSTHAGICGWSIRQHWKESHPRVEEERLQCARSSAGESHEATSVASLPNHLPA